MRKNKKFYNFTDKQRRKDRSVKKLDRDLPSADYRQMFNDEYHAKCKAITRRLARGEDVEFPVNKKCIGWYWW